MLEQFSSELLEAIFDTLPLDVTYVDENDTVRYYSKHNEMVFRRTPAVIGRQVQNCHPKDSLDKVNQVVEGLKSRKRKSAEFWINLKGRKVYIKYFTMYDKEGKYRDILEVTQDIPDIQKIEGQRRLLDEG
jgi:PAS domain S-box-containing protein